MPDDEKRTIRKVAAAAFVGSTVEWYDFFLYGSAAALVFGDLFFPDADPTIGVLAAFATFGVGFLFRPVGARDLRPLRRSHRPQGDARDHARADGRLDGRHRLSADLLERRHPGPDPARRAARARRASRSAASGRAAR